jgi:hypothetical protein
LWLDLDFEVNSLIGLGLGLGLRGPTRIGLGLGLGLRSQTRNLTWTSGPENRTLVKSAAAESDFGFGLGLRALPWEGGHAAAPPAAPRWPFPAGRAAGPAVFIPGAPSEIRGWIEGTPMCLKTRASQTCLFDGGGSGRCFVSARAAFLRNAWYINTRADTGDLCGL